MIGGISFSATSITSGLDADKPANPKPGNQYLATDTKILYVCYEAGTWVNAAPPLTYETVRSVSLPMKVTGEQYKDSLGESAYQTFINPCNRNTTDRPSQWLALWGRRATATPDNKIHLYYNVTVPGTGATCFMIWKKNNENIGEQLTFNTTDTVPKASDQIFDCEPGDLFTLWAYARNYESHRTFQVTTIEVRCTLYSDRILV